MSLRVTVSHDKLSKLSTSILTSLHEEGVPIGYSFLAALLAAGRLSQPDIRLTPEQEVKFVQDASAWVGMYWGEGAEKGSN